MPALCDARALWVQRALFHDRPLAFVKDIINTRPACRNSVTEQESEHCHVIGAAGPVRDPRP